MNRKEWLQAPGLGPCVYVATSDGLQNWAQQNDAHYLFKVGYTSTMILRDQSLNGRNLMFGPAPCLGFRDWRIIPCLDCYDVHRARAVEGQIKRGLHHAFEVFDPKLIIGNRRPSNGESEIFCIRPELVTKAMLHIEDRISNLFVRSKLQKVINAVIAEIADTGQHSD